MGSWGMAVFAWVPLVAGIAIGYLALGLAAELVVLRRTLGRKEQLR